MALKWWVKTKNKTNRQQTQKKIIEHLQNAIVRGRCRVGQVGYTPSQKNLVGWATMHFAPGADLLFKLHWLSRQTGLINSGVTGNSGDPCTNI